MSKLYFEHQQETKSGKWSLFVQSLLGRRKRITDNDDYSMGVTAVDAMARDDDEYCETFDDGAGQSMSVRQLRKQ